MMNSYRRTNTRSWRRLAVMTVIVIAIFAVDMLTGGRVRMLAQSVAGNISGTSSRAWNAVRHSGFFASRAQLAAQNESLQAELAQQDAQIAAYKALQEENAQLAAMAHLADNHAGTTTPIISSSHASPYGTFLIGIGSADGIKAGALVLTDDGYAIGRVTDASIHTALVTELFAPKAAIDGIITNTSVTFTGSGSGNAHAQIARDVAIAVGDIATSRAAGGYPVGIVGHIDTKRADAYSTVYIRLPENLASIRYVFVLSSQ